MGGIDALCKFCQRPMVWYALTPMYHAPASHAPGATGDRRAAQAGRCSCRHGRLRPGGGNADPPRRTTAPPEGGDAYR